MEGLVEGHVYLFPGPALAPASVCSARPPCLYMPRLLFILLFTALNFLLPIAISPIFFDSSRQSALCFLSPFARRTPLSLIQKASPFARCCCCGHPLCFFFISFATHSSDSLSHSSLINPPSTPSFPSHPPPPWKALRPFSRAVPCNSHEK